MTLYPPAPPPPEPEPVPEEPLHEPEALARDFKAHLAAMRAMLNAECGAIESDKAPASGTPAQDSAMAAEAPKPAARQMGGRVTCEELKRMLCSFLEYHLAKANEIPACTEITAERQAQLDRLKAAWPKRGKEEMPRKWVKPKGFRNPQWIKVTKKKPEPEPQPEPEPEPVEDQELVQVVLGMGDSSFVQCMEYYPKERKVRIFLASGKFYWFYNVEDDFMNSFAAKMNIDGGHGLPMVFTTDRAFDAQFGAPLPPGTHLDTKTGLAEPNLKRRELPPGSRPE